MYFLRWFQECVLTTLTIHVLQMFDAYKNHVNKGLEVEFSLDGFWIEDQSGVKRKVRIFTVLRINVFLTDSFISYT